MIEHDDVLTRTQRDGDEQLSDRAQLWASTMSGNWQGGIVTAHTDSNAHTGRHLVTREQREDHADRAMSHQAARASGAGNRAIEEEADPWRTCFDKDRDRIIHSNAFRRLAGKTQVFVFPDDHQRTRLTHALEVAQIARSIAGVLGANETLADAIALGHDCGHGPGGHASEDAFDIYIPGGFNHAPWGADVTLAGANLCVETLDGIRNHSWSLPAPATLEAEIVSWADRIAYVAHDLEDAVDAGIVTYDQVPNSITAYTGTTRSSQIHAFINAMIDAAARTGRVGMTADGAAALSELRAFNYTNIYTRPEAEEQGRRVVGMLRNLCDHYIAHPELLDDDQRSSNGTVHDVIAYVAGMTDRYACEKAVEYGVWDATKLPARI